MFLSSKENLTDTFRNEDATEPNLHGGYSFLCRAGELLDYVAVLRAGLIQNLQSQFYQSGQRRPKLLYY